MTISNLDSLLKAEIGSYGMSEWTGTIGGETVTLYSKPMTPADNSRVLRKFPNFNNSMEFAGMVEYILIKACDDKGERVFKEQHRPILARFTQDKIGEIFNALFGAQLDESDQDKVGNS